MKSFPKFIFRLLFLLLWTSCAIQVPPGGGEQDKEVPKVVKSEPENFGTNFKGKSFSITFDEFIQLKDVQSQLLVSPPLSQFPEVKIRKKTLYIEFSDTLEANATYSFNFGNAIVDNNEGNALENYQFVFSTGAVIDSLQLSGTIKNSFDDKLVKEALVMLYKEDADSIPFKKRPYYFGKANSNGEFTVKNISPGFYKVIGLGDENKDYLFNPSEEKVAFADSLVESGSSGIALRLFKEVENNKLLRTYSEEPGKAVCAFNGRADTLSVIWVSDTAKLNIYSINYSNKKDSLFIWYKNILADTIQLVFPQLNPDDTITIRLLKREANKIYKIKPSLLVTARGSLGNFQDLNRPFDIQFNHPVDVANINSIQFLEDSVVIPNMNFQFTDSLKNRLRYMGKWKAGASYSLFIPSGAFIDIFSLTNDTVISEFRTRQETDYASLTAQLSALKAKYPLLVQLVDDNEKVFEESTMTQDSSIVFSFLIQGMYRIKIVQDKNGNGSWDSGNYLLKRQAEEVFYYSEPIQMRANWDVDIKWQIP